MLNFAIWKDEKDSLLGQQETHVRPRFELICKCFYSKFISRKWLFINLISNLSFSSWSTFCFSCGSSSRALFYIRSWWLRITNFMHADTLQQTSALMLNVSWNKFLKLSIIILNKILFSVIFESYEWNWDLQWQALQTLQPNERLFDHVQHSPGWFFPHHVQPASFHHQYQLKPCVHQKRFGEKAST